MKFYWCLYTFLKISDTYCNITINSAVYTVTHTMRPFYDKSPFSSATNHQLSTRFSGAASSAYILKCIEILFPCRWLRSLSKMVFVFWDIAGTADNVGYLGILGEKMLLEEKTVWWALHFSTLISMVHTQHEEMLKSYCCKQVLVESRT